MKQSKDSPKKKNSILKGTNKKYYDFISGFLGDLEEVIFSSKINIEFPASRNSSSPNKVYIILTHGFIYIFSKNHKKTFKMEEIIDLIKCEEIKLIDQIEDDKGKDEEHDKNKDKNKDKSKGKDKNKDKLKTRCMTIKTTKYQECFTLLYTKGKIDLFEEISKVVFILSNGTSSEKQNPILDPMIPIRNSPISHLIYRRCLYYIHSDMKDQKISPQMTIEGAKYFDSNLIYKKSQLAINNDFNPGQFSSYYARAICSVPQVETISLQNFNHSVSEFVESILTSKSSIKIIAFQNYATEAPSFHFNKLKDEILQKFIFYDSKSLVLHNFFNGLQQHTYNITKICLSKLPIQTSELTSIFEQLNKIESFKHLKSFELFNTMIGQFPFESFTDFLDSHEELEVLTLSNIDVDGTMLLDAICRCNPSIYELHLTNLKFATILKVKNDRGETKFLPDNLILADFSYSLFNYNTLIPILQLLTNNPMKGSLMANFNHLHDKDKKGNYFHAFESQELKKCHPNIIDFNWSGNTVSSDFFNFICTQKNLKFISLMDMHIRNQKSFFDHLLRVMREVRPIGIEIGCESFEAELVKPFLSALKESSQLEHLCFESQNEQNEITASLSDLITSLPNLKEISINIPKLEHDAYINLAASIISNKSILAINFMKYEYKDKDKKQKNPEIEVIYSSIQKLKIPTTMEQRAEALILIQQENEGNETNASSFDLTKTIHLKGSNHQIEEVSEDENINADEIVIEEEEEDASN